VSGIIQGSIRFLNAEESGIIHTTRGRNGSTYVHLQIALECAQYLHPNLAVAVNQVFLEWQQERKNMELAVECLMRD